MNDEREELQRQMATLRGKLDKIDTAERRTEAAKFLGRCFKVRNNYSVPKKPSDYWWLYCKITSVDRDGSLRALRFQTDCDGRVEVEYDRYYTLNHLSGSYQPITARELRAAWTKLLGRLAAIGKATVSK